MIDEIFAKLIEYAVNEIELIRNEYSLAIKTSISFELKEEAERLTRERDEKIKGIGSVIFFLQDNYEEARRGSWKNEIYERYLERKQHQ